MNNNLLLTGIGVLVLMVLSGWLLMSNSQTAPTTINPAEVVNELRSVTSNLTLTNRKLTPDIVTVTQDDQVTIKIMSDETGEFHISGYEIEYGMEAGKELSLSFTADKAGRYNFELHPEGHEEHASLWFNIAEASETEESEEDIVIGAFVVNPR